MRSTRLARERLGLEQAAIVIDRPERPLEYDLGRNTDRTRSIFASRASGAISGGEYRIPEELAMTSPSQRTIHRVLDAY